MNWPRIHRKLHSWAAIISALPLLVIIATGLLLQLKKQLPWVQPPTQRGVGAVPSVGFVRLLTAGKTVPEAKIAGWNDVERLDIRPSQGVAKMHARSGWEVQVDTQTGEVLQSAYRRSDFIEAMHDGSFFHSAAKLWVFLPCGVLLLLLWFTGLYLWLSPRLMRIFRKQHTIKTNPT